MIYCHPVMLTTATHCCALFLCRYGRVCKILVVTCNLHTGVETLPLDKYSRVCRKVSDTDLTALQSVETRKYLYSLPFCGSNETTDRPLLLQISVRNAQNAVHRTSTREGVFGLESGSNLSLRLQYLQTRLSLASMIGTDEDNLPRMPQAGTEMCRR